MTLRNFNIEFINPKNFKLDPNKNKVVMVVNIATHCGYTPQLSKLEALYQKYSHKGFLIIGVPSNEFGEQTPGQDEEIATFCKRNYGVSFPITSKTLVKGNDKNNFFDFLIKKTGGVEIRWNFEKFLIFKNGKEVQRFQSNEDPLSSTITNLIEKELKDET